MMKLVETEAPNSTVEGLEYDYAHDVLRLAVGDHWFAEHHHCSSECWTTKVGAWTPL